MYSSTPIQALISKAGLVLAQILLDHRQRIYTYRLFTFPNNHLAKTILLFSFRNGDANSIQAED